MNSFHSSHWSQFVYSHVGDIIYSPLLRQDYIIVNSEKVARTLSDARHSAVYADHLILTIYKLWVHCRTTRSIVNPQRFSDSLGIESSPGTLHMEIPGECTQSYSIKLSGLRLQSFYMSKAISLVQNLLSGWSCIQSWDSFTMVRYLYIRRSAASWIVLLQFRGNNCAVIYIRPWHRVTGSSFGQTGAEINWHPPLKR
jgi:hypothetical protein